MGRSRWSNNLYLFTRGRWTNSQWKAIVQAAENNTLVCNYCEKRALYRDYLKDGSPVAACSDHRGRLTGLRNRSFSEEG